MMKPVVIRAGSPSYVLAVLFLCGLPLQAQKLKQYKKQNRDRITQLAEGETGQAIRYFEKYLRENPNDLEAKYGLAIGYAQRGERARSKQMADLSIEEGFPVERYLAGPRELTEGIPITSEAELIHGPMLGSVTDTSARFWVRTRHEVPVSIEIVGAGQSGEATTSAAKDYTAVIEVGGLKPDQRHTYTLSVDGKRVGDQHAFVTMPAAEKPGAFDIVFGGGAGYTPAYEHMWTTIAGVAPRALFLLGDNVYIDTPFVRATQQYCYYRRQSRPEFRALVAGTSVSAIWDDHDF
ncbi:MAG: tetratricopeptide repeat protein, partial [Verrucomicrobiota bacterium]